MNRLTGITADARWGLDKGAGVAVAVITLVLLVSGCAVKGGAVDSTVVPKFAPNTASTVTETRETPAPATSVETLSTVGSAVSAGVTAHGDLITRDLIGVLAQIDGLRPIQTTVQINPPTSVLGRVVFDELRAAGYGVQKVEADRGPHYVRYKFEDALTERGAVTRYTVSIGDVVAARDYVLLDTGLVPDSAVSVSGAPESMVLLDESLFPEFGPHYEERVAFTDNQLPELIEPQSSITARIDTPAATVLVKRNVFDLTESNYRALFARYDDVTSTILVFANDSMTLGQQNKRAIAKLAARLQPDTDIVSVIGCSHGYTDLDNGNSLLALGRANRVKEAFVHAGVDYTQVLDEGCWSSEYFDEVMPRRGVVVTLKRLKT